MRAEEYVTDNMKLTALAAFFAVTVIAALLVDPVAQDPAYFNFADTRPFLGIPNFGDVASNGGFLIVGVIALFGVLGPRRQVFAQPGDVALYAIIFCGITLVSAGSGYFHWAPGNGTLVWDRLPMTIAFMAFFAAVIADRIDRRAGFLLLPVLLVAGIASVAYWHFTEQAGQGDLRPYAIVQFFPMVAIPLIVWAFRPGHYTDGMSIAWIIGFYGLAKVLEALDSQVLAALGGTVSGHSLKHIAAAVASYLLYKMVVTARERRHVAEATAG
jgi:hypothetical protein